MSIDGLQQQQAETEAEEKKLGSIQYLQGVPNKLSTECMRKEI